MVTAVALISVLPFLALMVAARQDPPRKVNGLLHQSVELFNYLNLTLPVGDVLWQFIIRGKTIKVATFGNNQLITDHPQFTDRLEVSNNGTMLRIKDLRMEDTGDYIAHITLTDHETRHTSYLLTVYEPVPNPDIRTEGKNITSDWCNMTLHCSVPTNTSALSYTWMYRHNNSEYQLYNNGATIQVSLQPESWDMELLCVVHNPADQKNVSIHVQETCTDIEPSRHYFYFAAIAPLLLIVLCVIIWKIRRKGHKHAVLENYAPEVTICQPPNDSSQMLSNVQGAEQPTPVPREFTSLYSTCVMR